MNKKFTWDIFCRVIDNFGDIGVCWRLARQLAGESDQSVRLWIDDLHSLTRIWPTASLASHQWLEGVEVRHWCDPFPLDVVPAAVVIEAFACDIPDSYLATMAVKKAANNAPLWINLEYLSAERWVDGCHLMTSVHPTTGLRKRFFFPGFTSATGGLIRERALCTLQHTFDRSAFLTGINVKVPKDNTLISLFAYENQAIESLLAAWSGSAQKIYCLVPDGKVLSSINACLPEPLMLDQPQTIGNLTLQLIPFLTQTQYDYVLWACDINFVRGEDSFVRAQWAGKPFVWHIYPQEDSAHMVKLNAYLDLFAGNHDDTFAKAINNFWRRWNEHEDVTESWQRLVSHFPAWMNHSANWRESLLEHADLATQLLDLASADNRGKTTTEKP